MHITGELTGPAQQPLQPLLSNLVPSHCLSSLLSSLALAWLQIRDSMATLPMRPFLALVFCRNVICIRQRMMCTMARADILRRRSQLGMELSSGERARRSRRARQDLQMKHSVHSWGLPPHWPCRCIRMCSETQTDRWTEKRGWIVCRSGSEGERERGPVVHAIKTRALMHALVTHTIARTTWTSCRC